VSTPEPPDHPDPSASGPPAPATEPEAAAPAASVPPPAPGRPADEDRPSTWQPGLYLKLTSLLIAIGWSIAFVVKNTRQIPIDFVFATASVHLIWEILLLLAIGLVGGVLLSQLYRHRRRASLEQKARKSGDARADVGRRGKAVGKSR
jgi:uncharacterized integral membrane protein